MPLGTLFGFLGNLLTGGMQASATRQAGAQQAATSRESLAEQRRQFEETMKWMRESAGLAQEGQELENIRRSQEAQRRAARLEDVAAMFGDVRGMAGLEDIAGRMAPGGEADLRKAAMRELERGSGQLGAALASQGLTSSGYGARQQRGLAGDVTMGLAQQIAQNRMQQLMGQAGILGQLTSADLARLGSIANIYQDEAFGADLPYNPGELRDLYREMMGTGGGTITPPGTFGGTVNGGVGGALPAGMSEQQFEQALGEMWNQPDETGAVPSRTFGSFSEWVDYLKGTPQRLSQSLDSWWRRLTGELGLRERQGAMPEFGVGTGNLMMDQYMGMSPGDMGVGMPGNIFEPMRTERMTPNFGVTAPTVSAPVFAPQPVASETRAPSMFGVTAPAAPVVSTQPIGVRAPTVSAPTFTAQPVPTIPRLTEKQLMEMVSM